MRRYIPIAVVSLVLGALATLLGKRLPGPPEVGPPEG